MQLRTDEVVAQACVKQITRSSGFIAMAKL